MTLCHEMIQAFKEYPKVYVSARRRSGKTTSAFQLFSYMTRYLGKIHVLLIAPETITLHKLIHTHTSEHLTFSTSPVPYEGTLIEYWDEPESLSTTVLSIMNSKHRVLITATPTAGDWLDEHLEELLPTINRTQ